MRLLWIRAWRATEERIACRPRRSKLIAIRSESLIAIVGIAIIGTQTRQSRSDKEISMFTPVGTDMNLLQIAQGPLREPSGALARPSQRQKLSQGVKVLNEGKAFGEHQELRLVVDPKTRRILVQVIDKGTNEILRQIPADHVLRLAAVFGSLKSEGRKVAFFA